MTDLAWFKSSYSDSSGGECVEVAMTSAIHIRDSKAPTAPHVTVSPTAWTTFLGSMPGQVGAGRYRPVIAP
ncbi:DUF397 domain-containing protein [Streptomyces canus]|uniref:DUF397 domain-containing protein n=1 Tax=Streptomyces canus TaxID=58343 RepID=UPI0009A1225C|nr:DUF397 domain-containing protein [Streptomyces canus]